MSINLILLVDNSNPMKRMRNKLQGRCRVDCSNQCGSLHLLKISGMEVTVRIRIVNNNKLVIENSHANQETYEIECQEKNYIIIPHLGSNPTCELDENVYIRAFQFDDGKEQCRAPLLTNMYRGRWQELGTPFNLCIRISSIRGNIWDTLYDDFCSGNYEKLRPFCDL